MLSGPWVRECAPLAKNVRLGMNASDEFSEDYTEPSERVYDYVNRVDLKAYSPLGEDPTTVRARRSLHGDDSQLDDKYLCEMAGNSPAAGMPSALSNEFRAPGPSSALSFTLNGESSKLSNGSRDTPTNGNLSVVRLGDQELAWRVTCHPTG